MNLAAAHRAVERRRASRFELKLPLAIIADGPQEKFRPGQTLNLCAGGVLFTCDADLPIGERIEYAIPLVRGVDGATNVLHCWGQVLRTEVRSGSRALVATIGRYEFVRGEEAKKLASLAGHA